MGSSDKRPAGDDDYGRDPIIKPDGRVTVSLEIAEREQEQAIPHHIDEEETVPLCVTCRAWGRDACKRHGTKEWREVDGHRQWVSKR